MVAILDKLVVCPSPAHILGLVKLFCHISSHIIYLCHLDFFCCPFVCLLCFLYYSSCSIFVFETVWRHWRDLKKKKKNCCPSFCSCLPLVNSTNSIKIDCLMCRSGFGFPLTFSLPCMTWNLNQEVQPHLLQYSISLILLWSR